MICIMGFFAKFASLILISMKRIDTYPAKPFVKWVGGKTQLLEDIGKALPKDLQQRESVTYVEPFVGGGTFRFLTTLIWCLFTLFYIK